MGSSLKALRYIPDFLVYGHFGVALGAMLLGLQTGQMVLPHGTVPGLLVFLFTGTLCSYNIHAFLTATYNRNNPLPANSPHTATSYLWLGILAGLASLPFIILYDHHWRLLLLILALPFFYSAPKIPVDFFRRLRKLTLLKTFYLAGSWTLITTLLPLWISPEKPEQLPWLYLTHRFFMLYALCILFDYRDRESDAREGILSLTTRFSEKNIDRIFFCSILIVFISGIYLARLPSNPMAALMALLSPALLMAVLYSPSKQPQSAYFYYVLLDGLLWMPILLSLLLAI